MIQITINDKQILDFAKKSPARTRWASGESLKMCGGHYRKKLRAYIEGGGENWAPLSETSKRIKRDSGNSHTSPLYGLAQFVRFIYRKHKGAQSVHVGFMGKIARIARLAQYGGKRRVTDSRRRFLHKKGIHLKKTTKFINVPRRLIVVPFLKKYGNGMPAYMEKKFFLKFFSKEKPGLKI